MDNTDLVSEIVFLIDNQKKQIMEKIKKLLRSLRKKRNYTQAQLAEKLGISARAYAKIEAGETNLTIGRLRAIAVILDVSLTELLGDLPDDNLVISPVDTIPLLQHYQETIILLKQQNETLTKLLHKQLDPNAKK